MTSATAENPGKLSFDTVRRWADKQVNRHSTKAPFAALPLFAAAVTDDPRGGVAARGQLVVTVEELVGVRCWCSDHSRIA